MFMFLLLHKFYMQTKFYDFINLKIYQNFSFEHAKKNMKKVPRGVQAPRKVGFSGGRPIRAGIGGARLPPCFGHLFCITNGFLPE